MKSHYTNTNNRIDFPKTENKMNERIKKLAEQAGFKLIDIRDQFDYNEDSPIKKFAELIKQAIYDLVKEELIDDAIINEEPDRVSREYLKGCNGGTVDALCHIKNFGVDIDL